MTIDWPRFVEVVRAHQRFILVSHIRPDADALGSELGMAGVLEKLGKHVQILNGHTTPRNLEFLDPANRIKTIGVNATATDAEGYDALMVLDTSAWAQLGPMSDVVRAFPGKKIILDHHVSSDDLGAESFKNTTAEATGRLVIEAADHLGVELTPEIASPLFAALATDTGWFRFRSIAADSFRFAARLVDAGAVPQQIYTALYERDTLARIQLIGRIMARTETELDGKLVHTACFMDDFQATGAVASDTEDVVNMTLAVAGTQVAVIFVEQQTGGFKISFRSRAAGVDCSKLAELFNGGGHKAAAGAFLNEPYANAQKKILDAVRAAMK